MAIRDEGVRLVAENLGGFLSAMRQYNEALGRSEARTQRFASRARAAGTTLLGLTAPITAFGAISLRTFGQFEQQMARVQAVSGATAEEFEQLNEIAKEMGETTQFSARQAAGGLAFMAQAGLDVQTQIGALPEVLMLAAAAQLDMASAADIVTNVMAGFGLEVDQLTRANDTLTTAFTNANTDLLQLAQALKFAGPVANAAGLSFEETTAALATMGQQGIQATMAGTALRGAITRLLNPSGEARRVIERLGLTVTDAEGRMLPLVQIVEQLENAGLSAADAMVLFGQRAGPGMLALLEQGSGAIRGLTEQMETAGGITEEVSERQLDTFLGSMTLLTSAVEGLQINIATGLAPTLRALSGTLAPVITAVGNWLGANPILTATLFALAAVLTIVGTGLIFISLVIPGLVTGFGLLSSFVVFLTGAFAGLNIAMGPILIIVLAITAAIAAGILIWRNWGTIVGFVKDQVNNLIEIINRLVDLLTRVNPLLAGLSAIGINVPDIPTFAEGGVQQRSGLAMVGERGPELVSLPAGAVVSPISRNVEFNVNAVYTNPQQPSSIRLDLEALAMMASS